MSEVKSYRLNEKDFEKLDIVANWLRQNDIEFDNETQVLKTALSFAVRYVQERSANILVSK